MAASAEQKKQQKEFREIATRKIAEDVGRIVKEHRFFNDKYQEEFAQELGVLQSRVSHIENGKTTMALETIISIAHAIDEEIVIQINPKEGTAMAASAKKNSRGSKR